MEDYLIILEWLIYKIICQMDLAELFVKIKKNFMMDSSKMDKLMELIDTQMMMEYVLLEIELMDYQKENIFNIMKMEINNMNFIIKMA